MENELEELRKQKDMLQREIKLRDDIKEEKKEIFRLKLEKRIPILSKLKSGKVVAYFDRVNKKIYGEPDGK